MPISDELDSLAAKFGGFFNRGKVRELMEAAVANIVAFAHCDGSYGPAEQAAAARVLKHKLIVAAGEDKAREKFNRLKGDFDIGPDVGLEACEAELKDIVGKASPEERRMVMLLGLSVARAENDLGAEEKAWGRRAADALALDPQTIPGLT